MASVSDQPLAPSEKMESIGINLCSTAARVAYCGEDGKVFDHKLGESLIPPSILLPKLAGEPPRLDFQWPSHARGSGQIWPPEAVLSEDSGVGRLPLCYALAALTQESAGQESSWIWEIKGSTRRLALSSAVGFGAAAILERSPAQQRQAMAVVTIPNSLTGNQQQAIIDICRRRGSKVTLLWRPVAASLAWCARNTDRLITMKPKQDHALGAVVSVHIGLDSIEVACMDIVPRKHAGNWYFLPARGRPHGKPLPGLFHACEAVAERHLNDRSEMSPSNVWHLMWSTPWMNNTLRTLRRSELNASEASPRPKGASDRLLTHWEQCYSGLADGRTSTFSALSRAIIPVFPTGQEIGNWLSNIRSQIEGRKLIGGIVTGPFAALSRRKGLLADLWLEKLKCRSVPALIEGRDMELGVLARAAALHGVRLRRGLPTYLDTLPRVKILVSSRRGPEWLDLLREDDGYVDGGMEFSRSRVGMGALSIAAGHDQLEFDMGHEEHPTVRTHTTSLPVRHKTDVQVALSVSIRPAQGNARIEIEPVEPGALGGSRVFFDWKRMEDTGKTPRERLEEQPLVCPNVTFREQSTSRWRSVSKLLEYYSELKSFESRLREIDDIRTELRRSEAPGVYRYAVNSDGEVLNRQDVLTTFVETALADLDRAGDSKDGLRITRALAYSCTSNPRFQNYLASRITAWKTDLKSAQLLAIGRCLRDSSSIATFLRVFLERLSYGHDGTNIWVGSLSDLIRFREEALLAVDSSQCYSAVSELADIFEELLVTRERRFRPFVFRNVCVSIVYLLRRRSYDDSFLDPNEQLATHVKGLFRRAQELALNGQIRPIGGLVDVHEEMQRLIDYIDRRGRGIINMAEID